VSAALARREEGCASDLALDRWLLGELPGSDEGRKLEQHVKGCPSCTVRLKALRSLYQTVPAATVRSERPRPARPPRIDPATDGVMQVAILRDGLLVGTQVFTPGHYLVGSGGDADLQLEDLQPAHAQLYFRAGHGFPMRCATVRPIDEVCLGPYVLRVRIIQSRWEPPLKVVPPPPPSPPAVEAHTEVVTVPAAAAPVPVARATRGEALQLSAQLFWGETLVETAAFREAVAPDAFEGWGVEPLRGHALAQPSGEGFRVSVPRGLKGATGAVQLRAGEALRLEHGGLTLLLTVTRAPAAVAKRSWKELPWTVLSLCAVLSLGVLALAVFAPDLDEEPSFTPHPPSNVRALFPVKPPPEKPTEVAAATHDAPVKHPAPVRRAAAPPTKKFPPGLGGLASLTKLTESRAMKTLLAGKLDLRHAGGGKSLLASLAKGGGNSPGFGLDPHANGIGAAGLRNAVGLSAAGLGHGHVAGTVTHASGTGVRAPPGSGVDREEIAKVINQHLNEISACYERSMLKEGSFGGKLVVEWAIDGAGRVSLARVANATVPSPTVGGCILTQLKRWLFKAPRGGGTVRVSYPFMFQSVGY
jgi:hypothetical protein